MKNFLKNPDGTIKLKKTVLMFTIINLVLFTVLFKNAFRFDFKFKDTSEDNKVIYDPNANDVETTTIKLCDGCAVSFTQDEINATTNGTIDLSTLLSLTKVSISNVSFSISDENLATMGTSGSKTILKTGNTNGTFILTASYQDKSDTLKVNINSTIPLSYKFDKEYYYVRPSKGVDTNLIVYPYGGNTDGVTYTTEIPKDKTLKIGEKTGRVSAGKIAGSAVIIATGKNGSSCKSTVFIVPNYITTKVKEDGEYKTVDEYKVSSSGTVELNIQIEDNNNDRYTNANISASIENNGGMYASNFQFVGNSTGLRNYLYTVDIDVSGSGSSILNISLPDGSIKKLKLYN